jgi:hypothetical protein
VGFDFVERFSRDGTHFGMDFADSNLDVKPLLKLVLFRPEGAHFGQGVSWNHGEW